MTLRTQIILLVTLCLVFAVLATAAVWAWTARETILRQTETDGLIIAHLLSRTATFAEKVPEEAEEAIGAQMIVEASITAHLVAIAERYGMPPEEIESHLRAIVDNTALDEFWITDEEGHAYLTSEQGVDFTFSPNPEVQPQAYQFWSLLHRDSSFVQDARRREIDDKIFKYAGVAGIDKPRIVQVGYNAVILDDLRERLGLPQLAEDLVASGNVLSVQIVNDRYVVLAYNTIPGQASAPHVVQEDLPHLQAVIESGKPVSTLRGSVLKIATPIMDADSEVIGAVIVYLPTEHVWSSIQDELRLAALVALIIVGAGVLTSLILSRRVTRPIARLTDAAGALEANTFDPDSLTEVAARQDEIGHLARVFTRMAQEVQLRELRLKQEVRQMKIEIDHTQKLAQVAEITESEYFQLLKARARSLKAGASSAANPVES